MWPVSNRQAGHLRRGQLGQDGYILVTLTIGLVFLLGVVGLAIDIGRMYITRAEAQSFADAAALFAAQQLDGTPEGISRAQKQALATPKGWGFGLNSFTDVQTAFATA